MVGGGKDTSVLTKLRNWKCLLKDGGIDNVPNQAGILESFAEKP